MKKDNRAMALYFWLQSGSYCSRTG